MPELPLSIEVDFEWLPPSAPPISYHLIASPHDRVKKKNTKFSPWPHLFVSVGTCWKAIAVGEFDV